MIMLLPLDVLDLLCMQVANGSSAIIYLTDDEKYDHEYREDDDDEDFNEDQDHHEDGDEDDENDDNDSDDDKSDDICQVRPFNCLLSIFPSTGWLPW